MVDSSYCRTGVTFHIAGFGYIDIIRFYNGHLSTPKQGKCYFFGNDVGVCTIYI